MASINNSIHHLVPRSKIPQQFVQTLNPINTAKKVHYVHRSWHEIFSNLTPFEALIYYMTVIKPENFHFAEIVIDWENIFCEGFILGETKVKIDFTGCKKNGIYKIVHIFDHDLAPVEVPRIILKEWAPANYFYYAKVIDWRGNVFEHFSNELRLSVNLA